MYNSSLLQHPSIQQCTRFVTRHKPLSHKEWLSRIQDSSGIDCDIDYYGNGEAVTLLEDKMKEILGTETAMFVPKGSVGQYAALLHWSEISKNKTIAIHPQSHFQIDELLSFEKLLKLESVFFGQEYQAITQRDIEELNTDLAAICIELPTRRAGFQLPEWETLLLLRQFATANNLPIHIDGARLLESAVHFNKSYSDIAAIGDSVYVSLYKILGAPAGSVIAGNGEFNESIKPWKSRLGGDLYSAFPYVLSALWGLEHYFPRIPEFTNRAKALSEVFIKKLGPTSVVFPVQTNGFVVELPIEPELLIERALKLAEKEKACLFDRVFPSPDKNSRFELQVGDALDDWNDEELVETFISLL